MLFYAKKLLTFYGPDIKNHVKTLVKILTHSRICLR